MPLEIRELNIRVTVNQSQPDGGEGSSSESSQKDSSGKKSIPDNILQDMIEQTLKIINDKEER